MVEAALTSASGNDQIRILIMRSIGCSSSSSLQRQSSLLLLYGTGSVNVGRFQQKDFEVNAKIFQRWHGKLQVKASGL